MKWMISAIMAVTLAMPLMSVAQQVETPRKMAGVKATFSGAVKNVSPAVVNIFTEKRVQTRARVASPFFNDPFFSEFFGHSAPMRERVERSLGSGVIVAPNGVFVTNYHVVEGADAVRVVMHDRRELPAKIINADKRQDLAVMQLQLAEGERVPFATFGDSDSLEVGDVVLAIGNPFGFGQSVSMGILSALGRTNIGSPYGAYLQTDAAINPGNSGGALIDSTGKVIGINTLIYSKTGGSQGLGFAVPSNVVKRIVESIQTTGEVVRPWFGATGQDVTEGLAESLGLPRRQGVLINDITAGSPAAKSGIKIGDVIMTLDGQYIDNARSLLASIAILPIDEPITAKVWRSGREQIINLVFEQLPQRKTSDRRELKGGHPLNGYVVEALSPALNNEIDLPLGLEGVAVIETPRRANAGFGSVALRRGDIIQEVNGAKISSLKELEAALDKPSRRFDLTYMRGKSVFRMRVQR